MIGRFAGFGFASSMFGPMILYNDNSWYQFSTHRPRRGHMSVE